MNKMVLTDIKTWKDYFEGKHTNETTILETLLKENNIGVTGYTIAKILSDVKDKEIFEKLLKGFLVLPYVEIEKEDWIKASKIVFEFRGLSIELGLLCALSQRKNLKILTKNKEVKKNKGVKIYEDEKE